jgi:hypothetical protein
MSRPADLATAVKAVTVHRVTSSLQHAVTLERIKEGGLAFVTPQGWTDGPEGETWLLTRAAIVTMCHAHLDAGKLYDQYGKKTYELAAVELVDGTRIAALIEAEL